MTWLFQFVCALFGHADTIRLRRTKKHRLYAQNGLPTGFVIHCETEYLHCKRCMAELTEVYNAGNKMVVKKENT